MFFCTFLPAIVFSAISETEGETWLNIVSFLLKWIEIVPGINLNY